MAQISQPTAFRINTPRVVHETIDGETIIVDFDSGAYFSTDGAGAVIWEQVAANSPVNDIVHLLTQRYAGDRGVIENGVQRFLAELQRESLIVPLEETPASSHQLAPAPADINAGERPAFQEPSLHKFTDMQDLLLLDPIHDVDEGGWPIRKDPASRTNANE